MTWPEIVFLFCAGNSSPSLAHQIETVAAEKAVEKSLVLSVVVKESTCNAQARGASGEMGLMQVIPKWHTSTIKQEGVTDMLDPASNLRVGTSILRGLLRVASPRQALAHYNGGINPKEQSYRYADSVLELKKIIDGKLEE